MTALETSVVHRIASVEAMEDFGGGLTARLRGGSVIFLRGDLGSGKTTLVRGLLGALGYEGVVPSPTFTLLETYDVRGLKVAHLDLYRLDGATELEQLAIRDYLGEQSVLLVEWPERAEDGLPPADCEVHIAIDEDGARTVRLESRTRMGEGFCTG
ncbi:MAG: tRNA (adenosine(37)-N6)-threonylcarbamoyltransferase complex ATPase subunit type 1 TsaE [Arenicellales bacterium]